MKNQRRQHDSIAVISDHIVGSKLANAINVREMASALASNDLRTTLICRSPSGFSYRALPSIDVAADSEPAMFEQHAANLTRFLLGRQLEGLLAKVAPSFVFARSIPGAMAAARLSIPFVLESHAPPATIRGAMKRRLGFLSKSDSLHGLVTISPILGDHFEAAGFSKDKIFVVPDPVDTSVFTQNPSLRNGLRLPKRAFYAGHLYDFKGVNTLLAAAELLPHVEFTLAGGLDQDIRRVREKITEKHLNNVRLLGWLNREDVARRMSESHALLLPNEVWHPSARWTSPMKLGEYLATGNPILVSDIEAHRYWLEGVPVEYFQPGNPTSLAAELARLLDSPINTMEVAARVNLAETFSSQNRALTILELLKY